MNYSLNFVIPQGPTGPQGLIGPTGPTGSATGLAVYGGRYNNTASTITLGIVSQTQVPLTLNMPNLNTSYSNANSITVNQGGTYEINYYTNLLATVATAVTLAVRVNGSNIPATVVTRTLSLGVGSIYSGTVIASLSSGSVIDLAVSALLSLGITLGTGTNASLTIKKIN